MADADIIFALCAHLRADADVAALAGGRVFGGELPDAETRHMPRPTLVLRLSGGVAFAPASAVQVETQRVDLVAYGATPSEAAQLGRAARAAMVSVRHQVIGNVMIYWAQVAAGVLAARDADGKWPYSWQPFQIFHAIKEAA